MKNTIISLLLIILTILVLSLSLRGIPGSPDERTLNKAYWTNDGPLELSPERGKFALTYSIVENNSVYFSLPVARFATPDLGLHNGNYVSLFAPGVSFITAPGYILGKQLGSSQVGTYALISLFAVLNGLLIRLILVKLGVSNFLSALSGLVFVFATPSFAYAVSLYQHHISTFLILSSIYLLVRFKGIWPLLIIWFLLAVSLSVDNPNFFMMFPIGLYALGRMFYTKLSSNNLKIGVNLLGLLTVITALIPILLFTWFNKMSYGDPFKLGGTVGSVKAIDEQGKPYSPNDQGTANLEFFTNPDKQEKSAINFFETRGLLNGFYIHFFSPDRGLIYYSPVMILGFLGIVYLYKKNIAICSLLFSIMGTNILLYSMWGDPWGGWAFGSRYLIPTYAMLAIFLGLALMYLNRYLLFTMIFLLLFIYSAGVNTVGALTSSRNPPLVEVLALEKISGVEQKYTFDRNFDMLDINKSKSFLFNIIANKYLTAWQYYAVILSLIIIPGTILLSVDKWIKNGGFYDKS